MVVVFLSVSFKEWREYIWFTSWICSVKVYPVPLNTKYFCVFFKALIALRIRMFTNEFSLFHQRTNFSSFKLPAVTGFRFIRKSFRNGVFSSAHHECVVISAEQVHDFFVMRYLNMLKETRNNPQKSRFLWSYTTFHQMNHSLYSLSNCAKLSEKLTFLTPDTHTHTYVYVSWGGRRSVSFLWNFAFLLNEWSQIAQKILTRHISVTATDLCKSTGKSKSKGRILKGLGVSLKWCYNFSHGYSRWFNPVILLWIKLSCTQYSLISWLIYFFPIIFIINLFQVARGLSISPVIHQTIWMQALTWY